MTYAVPHLRLVVSGGLYGVDRFSWGLNFIRDFDPDAVAPETVPQGVIDAVVALHTASPVAISAAATLDTIKLNEIGTDGRYLNQGDTVMHEFETPVPGSSSSRPAPQVALAVTLRTAKRRGRAHAGRFYLPVPSFNLANGYLAGSQQTSIAAAATTMLNALTAALPGWVPAVMSDVGVGTQEPVTHVAVGRVLDTIRSRRNAFTEDYVDGVPLGGP